MDAALYAKILSDKFIINLKKIRFKYPEADVSELLSLLKIHVFQRISLLDFSGNELVFMGTADQVRMSSVKLLLMPQDHTQPYGIAAMEDEIASTLTIEDIDFQRDSIRRILHGYAPVDAGEERIYGLKQGLKFISNRLNKITEHNIGRLYTLAIGNHLTHEDDKLLPGQLYRHDRVYIVGLEIEHAGLEHNKLPQYMAKLIDFISTDHAMNDLIKAAIIHFYFAYIHPYFDGNGRMARLLHLWYLVQQGYSSAMFVSFSNCVGNSRRQYYKAFSLAEQNVKISGVMDITPFLVYYIENVYNKLTGMLPGPAETSLFQEALAAGRITSKERDLWNYTLSAYGKQEFTTKQLERDFKHAAYATIRSYVLKFENLNLLTAQKYGNKVKYRVNQGFVNSASDMAITE